MPSPFVPKRNEIIIFENPSYIPRGTVFDIAQRIIFMLTISVIDINRDETGQPRAQFLIKRAVGMSGDRFIIERGEMIVNYAGDDRWVDEREYIEERGWTHSISRMVDDTQYQALEMLGRSAAWHQMGQPVPERYRAVQASSIRYPDRFAYDKTRLETLRGVVPHDSRYSEQLAKLSLGWYVPEGRVMPLGDNRDNSRDGREFGPVRVSKVLGRGAVKFWPMKRIGPIR